MNQQTLDLLKDLAAKLGTTAEHLWSVLIKQAYISFVTDLILYAAAGFAVYILWKGVRACLDGNPQGLSGTDRQFGLTVLMVILSTTKIIIVLIVVFHLPDTVTKIANPEYWALQQILETVKGGK